LVWSFNSAAAETNDIEAAALSTIAHFNIRDIAMPNLSFESVNTIVNSLPYNSQ